MKLSSPTVIFLVLGLLFASMITTSSRETPTEGIGEKGRDGAPVQHQVWFLRPSKRCLLLHR
ncbi:hypothetical protein BHM03_00056768 [Ensete ventricosum]|nr:hypothetical protein BHM03_00056768 [Ensete ventricosum]